MRPLEAAGLGSDAEVPIGACLVRWANPSSNWGPLRSGAIRLIEQDFKPLLADYLEDRIVLSDFKSKVDGINKRNSFWGFKVIKGQRFFNMVVNVADAPEFCTLGAVLNPAVLGELVSQAFKETEGYMSIRRIRRVSSQLGATCQSVKGCGACS